MRFLTPVALCLVQHLTVLVSLQVSVVLLAVFVFPYHIYSNVNATSSNSPLTLSHNKPDAKRSMATRQATDNLLEYVFGTILPEMKFAPVVSEDDNIPFNTLSVRPERHRQLQWIHGLGQSEFRNSCRTCVEILFSVLCCLYFHCRGYQKYTKLPAWYR